MEKGTLVKKRPSSALYIRIRPSSAPNSNYLPLQKFLVTSFGVAEFSQNYAPKKIASTPNDVIAFIADVIAAGL